MAKTMASAQSLLGLVSQLQNMESSFTAILMEAAMKLAGLTDANVFILVDSQDGRRFSGKRYLCDAYLNGTLLPTGNDAEFEVNSAVSALQMRRHNGTAAPQPIQQQQQQQQQQHPSRMFSSSQGGRDFNTPSPFSSPSSNRQAFSPHSPSAVRKRQFPKASLQPVNHSLPSSSPLAKYPRVSPTDGGGGGGVVEEDGKNNPENDCSIPAADDQPVRVKDEALEKKPGEEAEDNDVVAEIVDEEEASTHSNPDGVAQQQQQQQQQQRHSFSGKAASTTSSSAASNGGLEINAWESSASSGTMMGVEDDFENVAGGMMDDVVGDYYGGGNAAAGFGSNASVGDELELMNLLNANLSSQKIHTLKCIAPHNACVKGTPENRLSTSLCYDFGKALAEAKPDDMDEIQAREFFFKNFELWVSQFDNLKKVFQKALPHGRPESGQTLTLLGFMRMSARSGFAQRSKRLKQLRENEQQRQFAGALMHGVGVASW